MRAHPKKKRRAAAAADIFSNACEMHSSVYMYRVRRINTEWGGSINAKGKKNTMLVCEHWSKWDLNEYLHIEHRKFTKGEREFLTFDEQIILFVNDQNLASNSAPCNSIQSQIGNVKIDVENQLKST